MITPIFKRLSVEASSRTQEIEQRQEHRIVTTNFARISRDMEILLPEEH